MAAPLRIAPKFIDVNRTRQAEAPFFRATLWRMKAKRYVREKVYGIAIGALGHETPAGAYFIERKMPNPTWLPPDSDWVGPNLRDPATGKPKLVLAGDPINPLVAMFIWLGGGHGVGFHGTANRDSIGTAASHGCLRMTEEGVLDLAKRVALGTPVFIHGGEAPPVDGAAVLAARKARRSS